MADSEATKKRKAMVKLAKSRLPSARTGILCKGCFAPDNTLTVTPHVEKIWEIKQLKTYFKEKGDQGVFLPCHYCKLERYLSLGGMSYDILLADIKNCNIFMLLREPRKDKAGKIITNQFYKALVGMEYDETEDLDLKDWS